MPDGPDAAPDDPRSEREKMLAGALYRASDPELADARRRALALVRRYHEAPDDGPARGAILRELLGSVGEGVEVVPPFHCDYGTHVHLADGVFINANAVLLDTCPIRIGARTLIGPGVQLYAATHPTDPAVRRAGLESGAPVTLGADVWVGGGAIVLPGVTIGDGAVVGAGSVVTRDVPPGVLAAGNPCRVIRALP